jgi:hypothetical protein
VQGAIVGSAFINLLKDSKKLPADVTFVCSRSLKEKKELNHDYSTTKGYTAGGLRKRSLTRSKALNIKPPRSGLRRVIISLLLVRRNLIIRLLGHMTRV